MDRYNNNRTLVYICVSIPNKNVNHYYKPHKVGKHNEIYKHNEK